MNCIADIKKVRIPLLEMAAIVFMLIAWGISLGNYTGNVPWLLGLGHKQVTKTIRPDFLSTLFACGLYVAFVLRKVIKPFSRKTTLFLTIFDIFYLASFISMLTGGKQDALPVIGVSPLALLVGVVTFSFIGMRSLSGVSVLLLIMVALPRLSENNVVMDYAGALFVVCGFISLVIQARIPDMVPVGIHLNELMDEFHGVQGRVSGDVASGVKGIENGVKSIVRVGTKTC